MGKKLGIFFVRGWGNGKKRYKSATHQCESGSDLWRVRDISRYKSLINSFNQFMTYGIWISCQVDAPYRNDDTDRQLHPDSSCVCGQRFEYRRGPKWVFEYSVKHHISLPLAILIQSHTKLLGSLLSHLYYEHCCQGRYQRNHHCCTSLNDNSICPSSCIRVKAKLSILSMRPVITIVGLSPIQ